jgi:hypothetical protein
MDRDQQWSKSQSEIEMTCDGRRPIQSSVTGALGQPARDKNLLTGAHPSWLSKCLQNLGAL